MKKIKNKNNSQKKDNGRIIFIDRKYIYDNIDKDTNRYYSTDDFQKVNKCKNDCKDSK